MEYKSELENLIETMIKEGASDLHLMAKMNPIIRVSGNLIPLLKKTKYTPDDTMGILSAMLSSEKKKQFLETQEVDFSYSYKDKVRFRGNGFVQQGTVSVALRLIPNSIKTFEELSLPPVLETFCQLQQGFFLVVGPVGQGKSTTLASMVERINQTRTEHIITIEDPIEYTFESKNSVINQREVEIDTKSFHSALRSAFRQDIDVVMVGEMRGPETMSAAVTAAETGHLVLSTLHTNNAAQTIDRIIDTFPEGQQDQIRLQLASSLAGIFSQRLVPRISGGLIPAYELLINNDAVANLIREKRSHEINAVIETGSESGMIDMNRNLADLVRRGEVTPENALARAFNPKTFSRLI
ncbi:type IV pilus twitching motility protein PilT [Patescibacteria group bacterium]|nr:type IV pilus twitching motility protein PilT [Patescibacteria group bacterium]